MSSNFSILAWLAGQIEKKNFEKAKFEEETRKEKKEKKKKSISKTAKDGSKLVS